MTRKDLADAWLQTHGGIRTLTNPVYEAGALSIELRARQWWIDYFLTDFLGEFEREDLGVVTTCDTAALNRSNGVCVVFGSVIGCSPIFLDMHSPRPAIPCQGWPAVRCTVSRRDNHVL